ncbi:hypothetical protein EHQ05_08060 [Leptospira yasudae]|uniref:hypothetical protein n=1 Tax=Leptospira yasudae TaxID=2202201 RepID=UPI0010823639|nr:hypothetical protein [Leptospira yasudae]TGK27734.1 hypothetical protein EHQ05_08060 [Leptospira yasudae]TGM06858.1 hypothetical protein EHQ86_08115 [Leptospira yasudae]
MMNKFIKIVSITILTLQFFTCKEDKSDDKNALMLLGVVASANLNATKTSAQVRTAVSGISNSISTGIQGGVASNFHFKIPKIERKNLTAYIQSKSRLAALQSQVRSFPTSLTKESGTCNTTSCTATLNGTTDCTIGGSNSGTMTLDKMKVSYTANMSGAGLSFKMNMDGNLTMNKCASQSNDWFNFPGLTTSITTGDLNVSGDYNLEMVSMDMATNTSVIKYLEKYVTKSSNLAINGGAAQTVNVTSNVDMQITSKVTITENPTFSNSAFKFKAGYVDTLTGTVAVSGSVGGGNVSVSRTYNNDKFTYDVACDFKIDSESKMTGDCTVTVK